MTALHTDLAAVAQALRGAGIVPTPDATIEQTRDYVDAVSAFAARDSVKLTDERLLMIATRHSAVPAKLYRPDRPAPPLLFYCHGGGFRQGTLAGWDSPLRELARASGCAILSIDYALAPERRFPVAFEQVADVIRAIIAARAIDGMPVTRVAAAGDSAGANLILGAALALRDAGIRALERLTLLYGVYSRDIAAPSWERLEGFGLNRAAMRAIWAGYLAAEETETDWRVEPLHADLVGLPPTRLTIGDLDPLIDENCALHAKLRQAGVPATLTVLPGVNHGAIRYNLLAPVVAEMLAAEAAALRAAFAAPLSRAG